jgi:tetratricopeptide (TPR) repeat protein
MRLTMKHDFNKLEEKARALLVSGLPHEAIKIYLFMADGDQSLDGGYLAKKIAECYEAMKDLHAAKYWYGRAIEENPVVRVDCAEARKGLECVTIDDLLM